MKALKTMMAIALAAAAGTASAQPVSGAQLSPFYAACLASGGTPGIFAEGERGTAILFAGGAPARLVAIAISPAAPAALRIALTAHNGNATLPYVTLTAGQSAAFAVTALSAQPNGRGAEYCLRAR